MVVEKGKTKLMYSTGYQLICFAEQGILHDIHFPLNLKDHEGIEIDKLRCLEVESIAAVYFIVNAESYRGEQGEKNMEDLEWLLPRINSHQQITSAIHEDSSVLPVRFGTLYSSIEKMSNFVVHNRTTIESALKRLKGKEEWDLKVVCNYSETTEKIFANIMDSQQESLQRLSQGKRYIEEKKIKDQAKEETDATILRSLQAIAESLGTLPEESAQLACDDEPGESGRTVVGHNALLMDVSNRSTLHKQNESINQNCQDSGMAVELRGPWPPYSFCPSLEPLIESV